MTREGYSTVRNQSLETRAPEVWQGRECRHTSDVWSLGVTLAHWLASLTIFGPGDKRVEGLTEAWCLAKLQCLVGPLDPPVDKPALRKEWLYAQEILTLQDTETNGKSLLIPDRTLRQTLESLPDPKPAGDLLDFIDYLLIKDHTCRPTAEEALEHPYLSLGEGRRSNAFLDHREHLETAETRNHSILIGEDILLPTQNAEQQRGFKGFEGLIMG
ncbi:MAG: hypothetical protein Q9164_004371 [Protoblastenia rupestris]